MWSNRWKGTCMADALKRAAEWLGLVSDNRYNTEADELTETVYTEEVAIDAAQHEPSADLTPFKRPNGDKLPASTSAAAAPVAASKPRIADLTRIITVHPRTYNEARTIGEHYRDGVPVIMNLSDMEDADAKRLVDFAAGLIFGLNGTIERVTSKVFLLSPKNVNVTAEDKERIASGGFFNQS